MSTGKRVAEGAGLQSGCSQSNRVIAAVREVVLLIEKIHKASYGVPGRV